MLKIIPSQLFLILLFILIHVQPIQVHSQPFYPADKAESFYEGIPENFKMQIRNAIPKEAVAQPRKKKKLLVINFNIRDKEVTNGHPSIPYANYAIYQMGKQTGAFETFFSRDTLVFEKDNLNQFDAIVLNNTVGVLFENEDTRQNLLDYVYGGKGIMGIHGGAGATFVQYPVYDQFPEFGQMMGGYENYGHPWKTHEWINMRVEERNHPINQGFSYPDFDISDEIFQYTHPYSRDHLRILTSINTEKTDMSHDRHFVPEREIDGDFAVSWLRSYGKGRVFNTGLGHHPHINWDLRILNQNFRAIQFILGDLDVATTPSHKLTSSILAQEKLGWRLGLAAYSFKDNTLFETIDQAAQMRIWYLDGLNVQKVSASIDKPFDHHLNRSELMEIRKKLLASGVAVTNYYIHDIPANEKECRKIFEFGKLMGIEAFISEPKIEALDMIENFCAEYNIKLAIHNHGKDISPNYWDPEQLLKIIRSRGELIGACGDIGYWTKSGIDPKEAITLLGDRLVTLQVHDLNDKSANGHDVPWGEGAIDLEEIFSALADLQLRPKLIGLEYSYNWGKSMLDIEKSKVYFDQNVIRLVVAKP